MTFITTKFVETDAEETARLAETGYDNQRLSELPVLNHTVDEHHVYELPWAHLHPCTGTTGGRTHDCTGVHRVVGIPITFHPGSSANLPRGQRRHDGYWDLRILASDHPSYPVGGYDIVIAESELRRSRVVEL